MVLTVDVGNTNIVFGGFEGDTLRFTSRIRTDKYQMRDEYAVKFLELIRFYGFQPRVLHIALSLPQQLVRYMYPLPLYVIRH